MEKEELMERIKRYEETIDYDFWFISSIKESVIEITDKDVNSAPAATPARTFSHGVTEFQPRRHGAEPQWSEGRLSPSELFLGVVPAGNDFSGLFVNVLFRPSGAVIGFL